MKNNRFEIVLFWLLFSSSVCFSQTSFDNVGKSYTDKSEWGQFFDEPKLEGTFVLYNLVKDSLLIYNLERAQQQFLPASTFKILNSLISLETKVVDENTIIQWDGVKRFYDKWNQDQNMKTAFPISCVWFYQELARRVGFEKMQYFLQESNYGNKKLGDKIDTFWLEGELRISAS